MRNLNKDMPCYCVVTFVSCSPVRSQTHAQITRAPFNGAFVLAVMLVVMMWFYCRKLVC